MGHIPKIVELHKNVFYIYHPKYVLDLEVLELYIVLSLFSLERV